MKKHHDVEMTACEAFWKGKFGDEYTERNSSVDVVAVRKRFFGAVLDGCLNDVSENNVIELGPNLGFNLRALRDLGFREENISGIEINERAHEILTQMMPRANIVCGSAFDVAPQSVMGRYDLVVSMGFLIHQSPDLIDAALDTIYDLMRLGGFVVIGEYFAPIETEVTYRGNEAQLWRRDYGSMFMNRFKPNCEVVDYGFVSRNDSHMPMDDINWWTIRRLT